MYTSQHLLLRHPVMEDWKDMYRNVWSHPETARYMLWEVTKTEEEAIARMERSIRYQEGKTCWFVYEKETGTPIGFGGFAKVAEDAVEDCGIALGPDYVGRGWGKELLTLLLEIAARDPSCKRFIISCRQENDASRGMILSCGFRFTHRETHIDARNGESYILEFYEKEL